MVSNVVAKLCENFEINALDGMESSICIDDGNLHTVFFHSWKLEIQRKRTARKSQLNGMANGIRNGIMVFAIAELSDILETISTTFGCAKQVHIEWIRHMQTTLNTFIDRQKMPCSPCDPKISYTRGKIHVTSIH